MWDVGGGRWEVGKKPHLERAKQRISVFPRATSYKPHAAFQTPTPALSLGEGVLSDANHSPLAAISDFPNEAWELVEVKGHCCGWRRSYGYHQRTNHRPQSYRPQAVFTYSPGQADAVSRNPGPMQRETPRIGLPSTSQPQTTGHKPRAAFPYSPDEAGQPGRDPGSMPGDKPGFGCRRC